MRDDSGGQSVTCQLRGRLKQGKRLGDIAAIGNRVLFSGATDGIGSIDEILPRKSEIVRLDPRPQGEYRQALLVNLEPHLRMLEHF